MLILLNVLGRFKTSFEGTNGGCAVDIQLLPQAFTHVVSASAGAVVSAFVRVPTDTLKHRVQAYVLPDVFRARPTPHSCLLWSS